MSLNEFKRIKHRSRPGDICKRYKIAMREKRVPIIIHSNWEISEAAAKVYRKILQDRSKKNQRQRDKQKIKEQIDE
jgi:hypothetical protein